MRRSLFILAGEVSGDMLAAWYVKNYCRDKSIDRIEGIGGKALEEAGVLLYEKSSRLNVTGIVEILRHIPRLLRMIYCLIRYLQQNNFTELIVVDFPGFNLALIKRLKKIYPQVHITYLSPPQLWCWGAWRLKRLKRDADRIIVLYPFEKEWYARRGVTVEWLETPLYGQLKPYASLSLTKKPIIAIIPGSRYAEIVRFMPLFAHTIKVMAEHYKEIQFVIPRANSFSEDEMRQCIKNAGLDQEKQRIKIVSDSDEKYIILAQCCCALTKPGTVTLELALLGVPSVVAFKISWFTYLIARPLVRVRFMALPNLFLASAVFEEFIQWECNKIRLAQAIEKLYASFRVHDKSYSKKESQLKKIKYMFEK